MRGKKQKKVPKKKKKHALFSTSSRDIYPAQPFNLFGFAESLTLARHSATLRLTLALCKASQTRCRSNYKLVKISSRKIYLPLPLKQCSALLHLRALRSEQLLFVKQQQNECCLRCVAPSSLVQVEHYK